MEDEKRNIWGRVTVVVIPVALLMWQYGWLGLIASGMPMDAERWALSSRGGTSAFVIMPVVLLLMTNAVMRDKPVSTLTLIGIVAATTTEVASQPATWVQNPGETVPSILLLRVLVLIEVAVLYGVWAFRVEDAAADPPPEQG